MFSGVCVEGGVWEGLRLPFRTGKLGLRERMGAGLSSQRCELLLRVSVSSPEPNRS